MKLDEQVAVRGVELDHVEAGIRSPIRTAATNWSRTASMSARVIGCGTWLTGDQGTSEAAMTGQLPLFQRHVIAFPAKLG